MEIEGRGVAPRAVARGLRLVAERRRMKNVAKPRSCAERPAAGVLEVTKHRGDMLRARPEVHRIDPEGRLALKYRGADPELPAAFRFRRPPR